MTPAVGYRVMDVLVNGASVGATTAYTFRNVRANQTIGVIFMPIAPTIFTITAEAGDGGEIEPSGEIKVGAGGSQKFDITPDAEHIVDDVEVNSQSMGPLDEYTFSNVQSDGHISVKFRLRGDVDGDGRVNAKDAILTLRIAAGLITPDERQRKAADMSGDGVVKSNDAILVLRVAAGL